MDKKRQQQIQFLNGLKTMKEFSNKIEEMFKEAQELSETLGVPVNIHVPSSQTERYFPKSFADKYPDFTFNDLFDLELDMYIENEYPGSWWYNSSC